MTPVAGLGISRADQPAVRGHARRAAVLVEGGRCRPRALGPVVATEPRHGLRSHCAEVERDDELPRTRAEVRRQVGVVRGDTVGVEDCDADSGGSASERRAEKVAGGFPRIVRPDERQMRLEVVEGIVRRELVHLQRHQDLRLGGQHRVLVDEPPGHVEQLVARSARVAQDIPVRRAQHGSFDLEAHARGDRPRALLVDTRLELHDQLLRQPEGRASPADDR